MGTGPLDYRSDPAKWEACGRLEKRFKAAIGEIDEQSVHVEVTPRWEPNTTGAVDFTQVVQDDDIAQVVENVNTLGNVGTLDLTENDITDRRAAPQKAPGRFRAVAHSTKIAAKGVAVLERALPDTKITHETA
jgi:hypothetical protein